MGNACSYLPTYGVFTCTTTSKQTTRLLHPQYRTMMTKKRQRSVMPDQTVPDGPGQNPNACAVVGHDWRHEAYDQQVTASPHTILGAYGLRWVVGYIASAALELWVHVGSGGVG